MELETSVTAARPKPPELRGETFNSIRMLRGVAAVLVVIFHTGLRYDHTQNTFRVGNAGVDIFFVISGFVMFTVTSRRPTAPLAFLRHRFIRLVPLYWTCSLVMFVAWVAMPSAFPHMHPTAAHLLLSLAFIPHVSPDTGAIEPFLAQGWTLNFEILFYLLFAASLALPRRRRLGAITAALLSLPFLGWFVIKPAIPPTTLLSPLLIEFLGGVWISRLVLSDIRVLPAWSCGCIAIGVGLLIIASPQRDDNLARLIEFGLPAMLIVGGAVFAEVSQTLVTEKLPLWIGDASYSIYLTHGFAISIVDKLWPANWASSVFMVVATLCGIVCGGISYALLERPLLAALRGRTRGRGR